MWMNRWNDDVNDYDDSAKAERESITNEKPILHLHIYNENHRMKMKIADISVQYTKTISTSRSKRIYK